MKILSWNVNGIRAAIKKDFYSCIQKQKPDIICLQETKVHSPDDVALELVDYPYQYWNCAEKKGYSGTAIFSKKEPLHVSYGMEMPEHDKEGRVVTLEFPNYYLVNVYTPNAQRALTRLDYRQKWDDDFLLFLKKLEQTKPVIFCGDLNVAHKEIDLARPETNKKNAGFTIEERTGFNDIIQSGFVDSFREFTSEGGHYTWWSYQNQARERNIGWRIDYFVVSPQLKPKLKQSTILPDVTTSDHCPIYLVIY